MIQTAIDTSLLVAALLPWHDSHQAASRALETKAWPFLAAAVAAETAGGGVYDAQILACARKAGVKRIFTLNERDFKRLRPEGFQVEIPA